MLSTTIVNWAIGFKEWFMLNFKLWQIPYFFQISAHNSLNKSDYLVMCSKCENGDIDPNQLVL